MSPHVCPCGQNYFYLKKSNKRTFADVHKKIKPSSKAQTKSALTTGDFFALKTVVETERFFLFRLPSGATAAETSFYISL